MTGSKYSDPISIPFTPETREQILLLAAKFSLPQSEVVRRALDLKAFDERQTALREQRARDNAAFRERIKADNAALDEV